MVVVMLKKVRMRPARIYDSDPIPKEDSEGLGEGVPWSGACKGRGAAECESQLETPTLHTLERHLFDGQLQACVYADTFLSPHTPLGEVQSIPLPCSFPLYYLSLNCN